MCHIRHVNTGKYGHISNYMIINYLNCLQKAATSLRVGPLQAAAYFDMSPRVTKCTPKLIHDLTNGDEELGSEVAKPRSRNFIVNLTSVYFTLVTCS